MGGQYINMLMNTMILNAEDDMPLGTVEREIDTKAKQQGLALDLADPLGLCKMEFGGFRLCNNIGHAKGMGRWIMIGIAVIAVIFGDLGDILAWGIGWIPIIGDILGNTVLGNIVDAIVLVVLFFLIGAPAFFGIGEFIDILGFIPVIGDIAGLIEWLPAWTFAIVIYGIYILVQNASQQGTLQIPGILGGGSTPV